MLTVREARLVRNNVCDLSSDPSALIRCGSRPPLSSIQLKVADAVDSSIKLSRGTLEKLVLELVTVVVACRSTRAHRCHVVEPESLDIGLLP